MGSSLTSGVSVGITGTTRCATIFPSSNFSFTKCTVGPVNRAPLFTTAAWTLSPCMPLPPNAGSNAGWMLSI
jgi:hypothetical protein